MSISQSERAAAIARIDAIRDEIASAATWLSLHGADKVAISLESGWHALGSALWDLERPARTTPRGWLDGAQQMPADQARQGWHGT